jgi:hypothetical protein
LKQTSRRASPEGSTAQEEQWPAKRLIAEDHAEVLGPHLCEHLLLLLSQLQTSHGVCADDGKRAAAAHGVAHQDDQDEPRRTAPSRAAQAERSPPAASALRVDPLKYQQYLKPDLDPAQVPPARPLQPLDLTQIYPKALRKEACCYTCNDSLTHTCSPFLCNSPDCLWRHR